MKELRLILGDQLNIEHSWFQQCDTSVDFVMMEVRSETDYCQHHVQKWWDFLAMREFADTLRRAGHQVIYLTLDDQANQQSICANLARLLANNNYQSWSWQQPDEYRLEQALYEFASAKVLQASAHQRNTFWLKEGLSPSCLNQVRIIFDGDFLSSYAQT